MPRTLLLLAALTVSACAVIQPQAAKDNYVSASFAAPPPRSLVLLLALPAADPVLREGDALLASQLKAQLLAAGYRVGVVDVSDYELLLKAEYQSSGISPQAGDSVSRAQAQARTLSKLSMIATKEAQSALLLRGRLTMRPAAVDATNAEWDGQRRGLNLQVSQVAMYKFSGETMAVSVELIGVEPNGALGFKTHGGALYPYSTNMDRYQVKFRDDLFKSDREVADGVRLALAPLVK